MSRTVAVTGVTGFIGRHIVEKLLSQGFAVRGLTRQAKKTTADHLTWIQGSLEESDALAELLRGADEVVHCAGQVRGCSGDIFTRCNLNGSVRLMQAAKASGSCERFLFISSLAARYPQLSWYANSKHQAEQQLTAMASDISLGIFRPTAVYGPGDRELKPVFNGLLRGILPCTGNPESRLSFLHVSDLAEAVYQWLMTDLSEAAPFELCDGAEAGYSWKSLQEIGSRIRAKPVHLIGIPLPLLNVAADISTLLHRIARKDPMLTRSKVRELTFGDWSASHCRLSEAIGWRPEMNLEQALRERLF